MTANNSSKISKKPLLTHQRSSSDFAIDYQAGLSTPLLQRNHTRGNTLDNSAIISQLDISHFDDNNPQPTAQATLSRSSNELNSLYATNPEEFGVNNPSLSSEPLFQSHDSPLFKMIASSTAEDYVHTSDIIVSPQQTTNQLALSNKSNKSSPKNSIIPQDINSTSLDISSAENPNDSLDTSVVQTDTNFKGKLTRSALFSAPLIGSCIAFNKTTNDPTSGLVSTVSTMTNLYLTQGLLRDSAVDSQTIMTHLKANTTFELSVNLASILGGLIKKPSPEHAATSLGLGLMMNIPNFIMEARYLKLARKKPSEIYHQNQSQDIDENMRSEVSFSSGNSTHGDATLERLVDGEDNIKNYKKIKNFGMKICGLLSTLLVVNNSIFPHNPVFNAILEGYLLNIAITTLSEKAKIPFSGHHKTIKPGMAEKFTTAALATALGPVLAGNDFSKTTAGKIVLGAIVSVASLMCAHNMDKLFNQIKSTSRSLRNRNASEQLEANNNSMIEMIETQNNKGEFGNSERTISISNIHDLEKILTSSYANKTSNSPVISQFNEETSDTSLKSRYSATITQHPHISLSPESSISHQQKSSSQSSHHTPDIEKTDHLKNE